MELSGERLPELARVAKLARLRRLLVPNRDPAKAEQLADALPEVAIATELTPHDRLDRPDPFDWRNVEWPNG